MTGFGENTGAAALVEDACKNAGRVRVSKFTAPVVVVLLTEGSKCPVAPVLVPNHQL